MLFDVKLKKTWFPGLKAQAHVSVSLNLCSNPTMSRQARWTATTLSVAYAWDIVRRRQHWKLDLIFEIPLFLYLEVGEGEGAVISGVPKSRASTSIRIKH